jgi:hypothetical protein
MSERNFRRYVSRFEEEGEAGLLDKRLEFCLERGAPVDEVLAMPGVRSGRLPRIRTG